MKKIIFYISGILALLSCLVSCQQMGGGKGELTFVNQGSFAESPAASCEGGQFTLLIESSLDWTAVLENEEENSRWLQINETEGVAGSSSMTFKTSQNSGTDPRKATILFTCGSSEFPFKVEQGITTVIDRVNQKTFDIPKTGDKAEVVFTSGYGQPEYDLKGNDWITIRNIEVNEKKHEYIFKLLIAENPGNTPRTGIITLTSGSGKAFEITFNQQGNVYLPYLKEISLGFSGGAFEIPYSSNSDAKIKSLPSWIKSLSTKSLKDHYSRYEAEPNTGAARTGEIVLQPEGVEAVKITVKQEGYNAAIADWCSKPFYKTSMIHRFTATWCGYCPQLAAAISEAREQNPDRIAVLSVYSHGSDPKVFYKDCEVLESYFKIKGFPSGYLDGRVTIPRSAFGIKQLMDETETLLPNLSADVKTTEKDGEFTINVKAYCKRPGNHKIAVAIVESNIGASQNGTQDTMHHFVLRKFLTKTLGDDLTFEASGTRDLSYKIKVADLKKAGVEYNVKNFDVIVYFIRENGKNVSEIAACPDTKDCIDNAVMLKLGTNVPLRFEE